MTIKYLSKEDVIEIKSKFPYCIFKVFNFVYRLGNKERVFEIPLCINQDSNFKNSELGKFIYNKIK